MIQLKATSIESERTLFMKVLVITPLSPPIEDRDVHAIYKRLRMFVQALAGVGNSVVMLHFVPPEAPEWSMDPRHFDETQSKYWGVKVSVRLAPKRKTELNWWEYLRSFFSVLYRPRIYPYVGSEQIAAIKSCLSEAPDLIFAHRIMVMAAFFRIARIDLPLLFDLDDVEHRVKIRFSQGARSLAAKAYHLLQVPALYFAEMKAARMAAMTFLCSELDRAYVGRLGMANVQAIPNALPIPNIVQNAKTDASVLYLGTYEYVPNVAAAERLISQIWPKIVKQNSQARLTIAGARPDLIPSFALKPSSVDFTGVVPDLTPLYQRSRIVCCPLTVGGGTRVKLVEAAGYGKPIVSTAIGAEGLSMINNEEILICDSDEEIAEACLRLLRNEELCAQLGSAARQKAKLLYDVANVREKIAESVTRAVVAR
jgi:glycosyltransferase involved in cell wall biosynthesis